MARRSSSSMNRVSARTIDTANDLESLLSRSISEPILSPLRPFSSPLLEVEDGRSWDPVGIPAPKTITGNRTWNVVQLPKRTLHSRSVIARHYYTNFPVGLQLPVGITRTGMFPVVTCVRRKIRKAVMFATGRTGKGAKAKRHYNSRSGMKC